MQLDGAYSAPASPGQLLEEPRPDADGGICECLGCGLVLIIICALSTLAEVRNTKRGGLLMLAPPCSTWIFLTLDTEVELLLVFLASIAEPFVCLRMLYVFFRPSWKGHFSGLRLPHKEAGSTQLALQPAVSCWPTFWL